MGDESRWIYARDATPLVTLLGWSYPADGRVPRLPLAELAVPRRRNAGNRHRARGLPHGSPDYTSCTLAALRAVAGVDLWLLGHIHAPEYFPALQRYSTPVPRKPSIRASRGYMAPGWCRLSMAYSDPSRNSHSTR